MLHSSYYRRYALALTLGAISLFTSSQAPGHGTVTEPPSRVYKIYTGGPESPDTPSAVAATGVAGFSQYYTWNQISQNVSNYASKSDSYAPNVPDGQLASGGNGSSSSLDFSGLDLVSNDWDWPATTATAGPLEINWYATAQHDPSYFKVWITKADYNHKTPLAWDKMEYLGQFNSGAFTKVGANYKMTVDLPARNGRHVLYVAWQRIDPVGEVFFSAVDLIFGGDSDPDPDSLPVVSVSDLQVNENAGNATIQVSLSKSLAVGETGSVAYQMANGTALDGSDYTASSNSLSFLSGELSKSIVVPINNDTDPESTEAFSITLSTPTNLILGDVSALVSILDDDTVTGGGVDFDLTGDWGGGYQGWLVIVNPGPSDWVNPTVTFDLHQTISWFGGGTRTDDGAGHHTVTGLGTVSPGGEIRFDLVVQPVANGDPRGPTNVKVNGVALEVLPPQMSITGVSRAEGDTTDQTLTLQVTLTKAHDSDIHFSYATAAGSALAGSDYDASSGNLTFTAGQLSKFITFTVHGNLTQESDKSFTVLLGGVSGEDLPRFAGGSNVATVTLVDDDGPIGLTATGGIVIEGDSGTKNMSFRLFLDRQPKASETVSVDYATSGHGATTGEDFTATSGTVSFATGQTTATLTVPVIGDTQDEALEVFGLHFLNPIHVTMHTTHALGQIIDNEFNSGSFGGQRVVAYVDGTSGSLNLPPANRVTHIMYAFANLASDGSLSIGGPGPGAAVGLKATNPDLKVLLSVGGWTWSGNFSAVAADPTKRTTFATACRNAIVAHNIDGIDLDWEWPGVPGGPGTSPSPQDGANLTLLLAALRAELDDLEATDGVDRHYEISAYAPGGPAGIAVWDLAAVEPYFDFINPQGYDLHGPWPGQSVTGHNASLHHNPADPLDNRLNIEAVIAQYLAGGFPPEKLLVGAPFFARSFNGTSATNNGNYQSYSGGGVTVYSALTSRIQTTPRFWDAYSKVPFLYDISTGLWTSYDDPQSMHEKALYSLSNGLGGVYFWRNGGDTGDRQLLTTIADTLAAPDADADTLSDDWERLHFGSITTTNGISNSDGDHHNNRAEEMAKTDPLDSTDFLHLENPRHASDDLKVDLETRAGVTYRVWISPDLVQWNIFGATISGDGSRKVIIIPAGLPALFVRVEVTP